MLKRSFDLCLALLGIVALSPLFVLLSLAIKCTSRGGVYYKGVRVGLHGKPFRILKFRTMIANAEKMGGSSTADGDMRVTSVGRILRKYKLDEIPQLINVLKGEMSFVGPRPEVQDYVDLYSDDEKAILNARPGITDWASIWNSDEGAVLAEAEDPDQAYLDLIRPTKLILQLKYCQESSLTTDIRIMCYTFYKILDRNWVPQELKAFPPLVPVKKPSIAQQAA